MPGTPRCLLFLSLLLLSSNLSHSFLSNYHTLFLLSHSLTSRVADLRDARGDFEGAARARALAHNLKRGLGLGFYKFAWNVGWDYVKNYAWSDTMSFQILGGVVSDLNELFRVLSELSQIRSNAGKVAWVGLNYKNALRVSQSLFARLLSVFRQSGPLRDLVLVLQKEVMEGELLRDCIELGADDLKDLIELVKDIGFNYFSASPKAEL
ncbi:hypothetical protein ACS0TY_031535 [Phlomoides rotata]